MSFFVIWDNGTFIIYCLFCLNILFFMCGCLVCVNPESWPVVGLCPHERNTGVFGTYLNTLYPMAGSF